MLFLLESILILKGLSPVVLLNMTDSYDGHPLFLRYLLFWVEKIKTLLTPLSLSFYDIEKINGDELKVVWDQGTDGRVVHVLQHVLLRSRKNNDPFNFQLKNPLNNVFSLFEV